MAVALEDHSVPFSSAFPSISRVEACLQAAFGTEDDVGSLVSAVDALRAACCEVASAAAAGKGDDEDSRTAGATDVWEQACAIWNLAVDAANQRLDTSNAGIRKAVVVQGAQLRHLACSLLLGLPVSALAQERQLQLLRFCVKASQHWSGLGMHEQSELLLCGASRVAASACATLSSGAANLSATSAEQLCCLLFEVHAERCLAAWKLGQPVLAKHALSAARMAAEELAPSAEIQHGLCLELSQTLQQLVHEVMAREQQEGATELFDFLNAAYELAHKAKAALAESGHREERPASAGTRLEAALVSEARTLYCLAWCHLEHSQDHAACLKCVDALRQLETPEGCLPGVALMAFKALLAVGRLQDAEREATSIAVNDKADSMTCMTVVLELLKTPGQATALSTVLELILGRFPADPSLLVCFTEAALAAAAASTAQEQQQQQEALQLLVLSLLEQHDGAKQAVKQSQRCRGELFRLLYNYGTERFHAAGFQAAIQFFTAAAEFAEEAFKGRLMRELALCHMGLRQTAQALSCCDLAESYQPKQLSTAFIKLKLLLLQEAPTEEVLWLVQGLPQCSGFMPDMLTAVFREASSAKARAVAKAALQLLLTELHEQQPGAQPAGPPDGDGGSSSSSERLSELAVLRVLMKMSLEELEAAVKLVSSSRAAAAATAAAAAGKPDADGPPAPARITEEQQAAEAAEAAAACILQLSSNLTLLGSRIKQHGLEAVTADKDAAGGQQTVEWFSLCAWNAALSAAELQDFQGAAVLMNASAQLLARLPCCGPKQLRQQQMAYLLAAAAALENHRAQPEKGSKASLNLARRMVGASMAAAQRLAAATGGQAAAGDGADVFSLRLMCRVLLALRDPGELAAAVQRLAEHPGATPEHLRRLADDAGEAPDSCCGEAAVVALEGCLNKLTASPSPDCAQVGEVLRCLVSRASGQDRRLQLYREAGGIMATLQPGAFPSREAAWLLATCWNWAVHLSRFGRDADAAAYAEAALALLPHCPEHKARRGAMVAMMHKGGAAVGPATAAAAPVVVAG